MDPRIISADGLNLSFEYYGLSVEIFNIVRVVSQGDWSLPEHTHPYYKFNMIAQGRGIVSLEGSEFAVGPGSLYLTGPYMRHGKETGPDDPMILYILECDLKKSNTSGLQPYMDRLVDTMLDVLAKPQPYAPHSPDTVHRFASVFAEIDTMAPGYILKAQSAVLDTLTDFYRLLSRDRAEDAVPRPKTTGRRHMDRLLRFIELNYTRPITQQDASRVLFLSPRQISRLIRSEFGTTFHRYLTNYRTQCAVRLLRDTTLTINEVAEQSGFSSYHHLYLAMKRNDYPSPGEIRKTAKIEQNGRKGSIAASE